MTSNMHRAFATRLPSTFPINISALLIGAAMRRSPVLRIRSPRIKELAPSQHIVQSLSSLQLHSNP